MKAVAALVRPPPPRGELPGALSVNYDREISLVLGEAKLNTYNGLVRTAECFKTAPHSGVFRFVPAPLIKLKAGVDVAVALEILEKENRVHPPFANLWQLAAVTSMLGGRKRIVAFGQYQQDGAIRSYPYIGENGSECFIALKRSTFGIEDEFFALVGQQVPLR